MAGNRPLLLGMVLLGALFGAAGMWLANRVAPGDLAAADRVRVERVVRDYVLANPELIPEAMQRLQSKQASKAVNASRGALEEPYKGAFIGNPKGSVTLVEFYDYNCGYCRAALPTLERLVRDDDDLRIVFREFPILADSSKAAARASLTAAAQNRFKPFHDALYAAGPVTDASIRAAAARTGVDLSKAPADADEEIARNAELAAGLGINGTPSWVVGDQLLTGALPLDQIKDAIAKARAAR